MLRRLVGPLVPRFVLRRLHLPRERRLQGRQSLADLFSTIYRQKDWGGGPDDDFYSGSGSHAPEVLQPFVVAVRAYLSAFPQPPIVVDLGCGDFSMGGRLADLAGHYHACDIVPELIARNRRLPMPAHVSFHLLDAVTDPLPQGDVVIVKQVLQHLANDHIAAILRKLAQYPVWIITEHLPAGQFTPNRDKLAGSLTRLALHSGIVPTEKPFDVEPRTTEVLSVVNEDGNRIKTVAYRF